ncbi:hypothetical protein FRB94_013966 [Tulasnella sp. JGI-2019a]|nr:hypothetical protein FRB94_013966 [Tulasnella sp. JGI-2019a]
MPSTALYGTWKSPISAAMIAKQAISVAEVHVDPITKTIYHSEARPSEGGRIVPANTITEKDVFGKGWNARTAVHEYGGAALTIHDTTLYFTNFKSRRLYVIGQDGNPEPVSAGQCSSVIFVNSHFVVSILEDHTHDVPASVVNTLIAINTKTQALTTLARGADFYSTPHFSPNGKLLSFICWNHPNMPWEGSKLVLGLINNRGGEVELIGPSFLASKEGKVSITQAQWVSNDVLVFFSDESRFYNPWKYDNQSQLSSPILPTPAGEEYAGLAWLLGILDMSVLDLSTVLVAPLKMGLALLDVNTGALIKIKSPFVSIHAIHGISNKQVVFISEQNNDASAIICLTLKSSALSYFNNPTADVDTEFETLKSTSDVTSIPPLLFPISLASHSRLSLTIDYYT